MPSKCAHCGTAPEPDDRYFGICGNRLQATRTTAPSRHKPRRTGPGRTSIWKEDISTPLTWIAIIAVCFIGYKGCFDSKSPERSTAEAPAKTRSTRPTKTSQNRSGPACRAFFSCYEAKCRKARPSIRQCWRDCGFHLTKHGVSHYHQVHKFCKGSR
jgi:hypothetical protein